MFSLDLHVLCWVTDVEMWNDSEKQKTQVQRRRILIAQLWAGDRQAARAAGGTGKCYQYGKGGTQKPGGRCIRIGIGRTGIGRTGRVHSHAPRHTALHEPQASQLFRVYRDCGSEITDPGRGSRAGPWPRPARSGLMRPVTEGGTGK